MDNHKTGRRFTFIAAVMFTVSVIFCSSVTFGATSDWPSVLKSYPNAEFYFADMDGDKKSELFVYDYDNTQLIVYANRNGSYIKAGTVTCKDYSAYSLVGNIGIAVSRSLGNGWCYDKYVLSGDKLVQDGVIVSYEYSGNNEEYKIGNKPVSIAEGRKKIDELYSMSMDSQTYKICSSNDWYSVYKNVIDQYINIVNESGDESAGDLAEKYTDVNINYLTYERTDRSRDVSYALKDLDSNGTPELIIANGINYNAESPTFGYTTFNIYTLKDGVLINFEKDMADRYRCHILDTNEIYEESSGGALVNYWLVYKLNDGKFEAQNIFAILGETIGSSDVVYSFKNGVSANESELENLTEQYRKRVVQLDWKPLSNYKNEGSAAAITVLLNGNKLSFDQAPFIENGTTFVPMRAIFEAMGAAVDWNSATQTVTAKKDGTNISLTINNKTAKVNGNNKSLNVAPKLVNGSTMVPLRFVSESLGAEVNWDDGSRTVSINNK